MVFSSYRFSVQEIVSILNLHSPLITAKAFLGQQSTSKATQSNQNVVVEAGKRGMSQKEQKKVMREFRDGLFNVLVATSIGRSSVYLHSLRCDLFQLFLRLGLQVRRVWTLASWI